MVGQLVKFCSDLDPNWAIMTLYGKLGENMQNFDGNKPKIVENIPNLMKFA